MLTAATRISAAINTITVYTQRMLVSIHDTIEQVQRRKVLSARKNGSKLTNPLEFFTMTMTQLVFEHSKQVRNDVQSLI